nr:hypothetical protein KXZ65_21120 [Pectobacterium sp. PL152]
MSDAHDLSEVGEGQCRGYLMGWVPGSEMEKIYNRRHIITEANKNFTACSEKNNQGDAMNKVKENQSHFMATQSGYSFFSPIRIGIWIKIIRSMFVLSCKHYPVIA